MLRVALGELDPERVAFTGKTGRQRSKGMGEEQVITSYVVLSGRHAVALQNASSAQEALIDYLKALGCRDDEIVRMGTDSASWRGAVYRVQRRAATES